jgi:tRNA(Ile)-lysidine synthase
VRSRAWLDIRPFFCAEEMLLEFEKKLADFINANELLGSAEKVLLAVSGGADSIALMYSLHTLKAENFFDAELLCAHINHQLRGAEGDLDEEFVVTQAKELKLVVTTRRTDVRGFARLHKLSIETAARQLRMKALIDIAKAGNCNLIATAHQKNDNAETIIQRLSRGTGFRGLGGIWPERIFANEIKFIRPMLCFRRDEILKYLQKRNLEWRRDHTNADYTYRRNYIRHRFIPALQQDCTGSLVEQLAQLAESARRYYNIVCKYADELWPDLADCDEDKTELGLKLFGGEPMPVKVELIRRCLANIGCGEKNITQGHYEGVLRLAEQNITGRKMELPGGFAVRREYGNLIFSNRRVDAPPITNEPAKDQAVTVEIPGQTRFGGYLIEVSVSVADKACEKSQIANRKLVPSGAEGSKIPTLGGAEWFDLDKIKPPLTIRHRRPGDRFVPLGQSGEKKLGKFLTAQRVPQEIRRAVLVVIDREKIIWVWPVRMSEQSKITGQTRKILQLQITNLNA